MAQRIVRAKAKIRNARIPYIVPSESDLPDRLEAVLCVIYLVFNEGYSASSGDSLARHDLSSEAVRLGRLVLELLPEPEVIGLLALMLLHESRRAACTSLSGDVVLFEEQDLRCGIAITSKKDWHWSKEQWPRSDSAATPFKRPLPPCMLKRPAPL